MDSESLNNFSVAKKKKTIGIIMVVLSLVLFVFSTFEFLYGVKAFLLGVFGIMLYPILLFMLLCGVAFIMNKRFVYSPKYILYLCLAFFFLMCVLQIIFTGFREESLTYGEYLRACFYSLYTPGGVVIGVLTFPITSLLHDIAGIVIYGIALIISIYFIISYLDEYKQKIRVANEKPSYQTFHFDSDDIEYYKEEKSKIEPQETVEEEIETEEPMSEEEYKQERAKELLGLKKREEDVSEIRTEEQSRPRLYSNSLSSTWQNRAMREEKPQKFIYEDEKVVKKENPLFKENIEYLSKIHDMHNQNDNPIINAEDYEDYKEKMRLYNERQTERLKREEVSEVLEDTAQRQEIKKINNYEIEPEKKFNFYDEDEEEVDDISNLVDLEEDFIKPETLEKKFSPLNPNSFNQTDNNSKTVEFEKREPVIESDNSIKSQKFVDETYADHNTNESVESSLGQTVNLNRNFNFEVLGGGDNSHNKKKEPNFDYPSRYVRPPIDLLRTYPKDEDEESNNAEKINVLENVLNEFKVPAKVEAVRRGAAVTRYELHMPTGIPVKKIHAHSSDIALALAAKSDIRIETPIRGKSAVGIEVPNDKISTVGLKEIVSSPRFTESKAPLTFALGEDVDGNVYCCNLDKMPHLLVAGSTGSGKSVCLNALILSFLFRTSPEDLRIILVDPKRVEFGIYNDIPHLLMPKAVTEPKKALQAFDWLIDEMERRFTIFQECFVKNLQEYNAQPEVLSKKLPKLPYLVLIVDELADLVVTTNKKELEERIIRLTQKARAAGIHLILATQRPSVDIITGSIKINLPTRIAFAVTNYVDSKTILDQGGAEKLLGKGDMLYSPRDGEPIRVQGAFVDTPEVKAVVDFVKANNPCYYDENIEKAINSDGGNGGEGGYSGGGTGNMPSIDSLMPDALKLVIENGQASISLLQRRFAIGYQRAAKIIDQMEMAGFISSSDGSKPRSVYMTMEDYNKIYGSS